MSHHWIIINFLFSICLLSSTVYALIDPDYYNKTECSPGLIGTAGTTYPPRDIILKYGEPLNIYCILNEEYVTKNYPDKNSSNIVFYSDNYKIKSEFVTIINKTTALLTLENLEPQEYVFSCYLTINQGKYLLRPVCLNVVMVGYPPLEPLNFDCISYNWQSINCTWTPAINFVRTTYILYFTLGGNWITRCPTESEKLENGSYQCMWSETTDPIYRQPYENYTFLLIAQNQLGKETFTYKINNYARLLPNKPENLKVINVTLNSAALSWEYPYPLSEFPPGLHEKIVYRVQWNYKALWKIIKLKNIKRSNAQPREYVLTGLRPNTEYNAGVLLKSPKANENMWSDLSGIAFKTKRHN